MVIRENGGEESISIEKDCEKAKRQVELALEAGDLGYWDWNLKTGEAYFNPTAHKIMGYKTGDIPSRLDAWMDLIHPDDRESLTKRIKQNLIKEQSNPEELRIRCKNGEYKWFAVKGKTYEREPDNKPDRALGVIYDIDKKKKEERIAEKKLEESQEAYKRLSKKLEEAAVTDDLTGLPNRQGFNRQLIREWKRTGRTKQPLTVLIIDIDYFKYYNDSKGRLAGDQLLQKVADTLKKVFKRPSDYFARYGGDEFIALIPDTDWVGGIKLAETCRKTLERLKIPNTSAPQLNHVTISVGIGTVEPSEEKSPEELIKKADRALYKAKSNGRNRTEYEPQ